MRQRFMLLQRKLGENLVGSMSPKLLSFDVLLLCFSFRDTIIIAWQTTIVLGPIIEIISFYSSVYMCGLIFSTSPIIEYSHYWDLFFKIYGDEIDPCFLKSTQWKLYLAALQSGQDMKTKTTKRISTSTFSYLFILFLSGTFVLQGEVWYSGDVQGPVELGEEQSMGLPIKAGLNLNVI